uniref:phosphoglucomutase-2-like n=1 Tax=Styela clava TaxID=7725 RepID=UPI00193A9AF9|nr:phosphoglucomutase-2-like [Styela clava]
MGTGNENLDKACSQWLEWDRNELTRKIISELMQKNDVNELQKCLGKRMEFGTAGLRAAMGAGFSKMNDLTIIQTTQGFAKYLQQKFSSDLNQRGVVIGYDARHNSERFARLAAAVFIHSGIKCYLYRGIVPTPFVPYGVRKYKTCAGIMVTASHNPKQDNGYKVYWDNGAQIISPHDSGIAESIMANLVPWCDDVWNDQLYKNHQLHIDPLDEVMKSYFKDLKSYSIYSEMNKTSALRFTYTPVHGVGLKFAEESFKTFQHKPFFAVEKQKDPDPEFPTVKYPNPEEGKGVLTLAMETADSNNCDVILANDPDADRLAIAEKQEDKSWKIFTGNELGALFGWWAWHRYLIKKNNDRSDVKNVYMISSTVSSNILKSMAKVEGFNFEDTLTGFKWMGNRTDELMKQGKTVLFAFEEAIGYMFGTNVLDKDGISALSVIAEAGVYLRSKNMTFTKQLDEIYSKYGFHTSNNSYYISYDQQKIAGMFHRLRNYTDSDNVIIDEKRGGRYPKMLDRFEITDIRDLTTGFDSRQEDKTATLPTSKSSEMLTFYFRNGVVLTLRTSGTEPKIKYYSEIAAAIGEHISNREANVKELGDLITAMCKEFYQPEKNNFQSKSS